MKTIFLKLAWPFRKLAARIRSAFIRVLDLKDNPRKIAGGFALGSFFGVTPFPGCQVLFSVSIATLLKWNRIATAVGVFNTNWGKGWFIYPINYALGSWIIGNESSFAFPDRLSFSVLPEIFAAGAGVFFSLVLGGVITGGIISLGYYHLFMYLLKRRRDRSVQIIHKQPEMKTVSEGYALITGASQGLGRAMAMEFARRNTNVLLVSLPGEGLEDLAECIRVTCRVKASCLEIDMSRDNAVYIIAGWASKYPVHVLVNNAGIGGTKAFEEATPEYIDAIIQINIRSLSLLTRLMLPALKKQDKAYIMNVASMASFSPIGFKTVYPASKAFVYSFSRGLYTELRDTNVFVTVLHPGPMKTNADVTRRIDLQGRFAKLGLISAERMARIAVRQMYRRDTLILPGFGNQLNWLLIHLVPVWIRLPVLSKAVRNEIVEEKSSVLIQ